jgi:hypothetical protein
MISRPFTRRTIVIATTVALVALTSSALAYWGGAGSGSSQTQLGDPKPLVLSPGTSSAQLYPGDDASVAIVATNSNPYPVHIGSLSLDPSAGTGGFDVDGPHGTCGVSTLGFTSQGNGGHGWTVPPKAGATDGTLNIGLLNALTMGTGAANACQGATFTIHLVAGD